MMAQHFDPSGIWSPFGASSMCVVQGDDRIVVRNDMQAQVRRVLENVRTVLDHVGEK